MHRAGVVLAPLDEAFDEARTLLLQSDLTLIPGLLVQVRVRVRVLLLYTTCITSLRRSCIAQAGVLGPLDCGMAACALALVSTASIPSIFLVRVL